MTMTVERDDDLFLQPFFEAARAAAPEPSPALMARLEADALAEGPRPAPARPAMAARAPRRGWRAWLAGLVDLLGGWAGLGGLATAAVAGIWVGVALPGPLSALDAAFAGTGPAATGAEASLDLIPDLTAFLTEG